MGRIHRIDRDRVKVQQVRAALGLPIRDEEVELQGRRCQSQSIRTVAIRHIAACKWAWWSAANCIGAVSVIIHIDQPAGNTSVAVRLQQTDVAHTVSGRVHAREAEREGLSGSLVELVCRCQFRVARPGAVGIRFDHLDFACGIQYDIKLVRKSSGG